jgi:hypothetical protein
LPQIKDEVIAMKRLLIVSLLFFFLPMNHTEAKEVLQTKVLKVTITEPNQEIFLAYVEPNQYFYKVGNEEISGEQAEKTVKQVITNLHLTPDTTAEELKAKLKSSNYPNLQKLDVRWIDQSYHLYTWIWDKSN